MKTTFKSYTIGKEILKAIDLLGYKAPTAIQAAVLKEALIGKDLCVKAPTGSGKTAAFAIPLCEKIEWEERLPQALVLSPTRELAMQIKEDFFHIGRLKRLKVVALYGKTPFKEQQQLLRQRTHIVVGTPGRILDHLERGTLQTDEIRYLVIDEADEMLRMGFMEQIESIVKALPKERQTLLFSATLKSDIEQFCGQYMQTPLLIETSSKQVAASTIEEQGYLVEKDQKLELLKALTQIQNPDACMIFCNTREQVNLVGDFLIQAGYSCETLHGDKEQSERFRLMKAFRKGQFRYLVATDVAARGIDIDHITYVVNFDVPQEKENYVHRIGRTGRAGRSGKAVTLITKDETYDLAQIEAYIGHKLPICKPPSKAMVEAYQAKFQEKMKEKVEIGMQKGEVLNQGILKLHINAGKKTKMRPVDIVGALSNLPGMTGEDIGIINVQDISTFVEIMNGKGERVYELLQNTPIKGRIRRVSKVEK